MSKSSECGPLLNAGSTRRQVCTVHISNPISRYSSGSCSIVIVSYSSARQRAGRAGRVTAGKCFRLYTQVRATQVLQGE